MLGFVGTSFSLAHSLVILMLHSQACDPWYCFILMVLCLWQCFFWLKILKYLPVVEYPSKVFLSIWIYILLFRVLQEFSFKIGNFSENSPKLTLEHSVCDTLLSFLSKLFWKSDENFERYLFYEVHVHFICT